MSIVSRYSKVRFHPRFNDENIENIQPQVLQALKKSLQESAIPFRRSEWIVPNTCAPDDAFVRRCSFERDEVSTLDMTVRNRMLCLLVIMRAFYGKR